MKVVAIVAARMASTRLPGKHLMDLGGRPMLAHVLERAKAIKGVDEVVVATTMNAEDDALLPVCEKAVVPMFRRNHPNDVLARYADCACHHKADVVVRLTADCPLLDPALASMALELHQRMVGERMDGECDSGVSAIHADYWLDGLDVEVFGRDTLLEADNAATDPSDREHVTPYIVCGDGRLNIRPLAAERALLGTLPGPWRKWSVDTPEDLVRVRAIVAQLDAVALVVAFDVTNRLWRARFGWQTTVAAARQAAKENT